MMTVKRNVLGILLYLTLTVANAGDFEETNYGVKYASNCEVCKILASELEAKLEATAKLGGLIETSYHIDKRLQEKKEYKTSLLRLLESMESACDGVLLYNIHKERKDSTRFAKGQSETFSTLHGLVAKGVKVDIGIPYEMWDKPSAEVTQLKSQCEEMLERYESDIEDWYEQRQGEISLQDYLCKSIVLKNQDASCLTEKIKKEPEHEAESKPKTKSKKKQEL